MVPLRVRCAAFAMRWFKDAPIPHRIVERNLCLGLARISLPPTLTLLGMIAWALYAITRRNFLAFRDALWPVTSATIIRLNTQQIRVAVATNAGAHTILAFIEMAISHHLVGVKCTQRQKPPTVVSALLFR